MINNQKEEYTIVLDFLPNGYPFDKKPSHLKTPIVQVIGKEKFGLLELVPKKDIPFEMGEEVYIGEGKRDKVHHVLGRLPFEKLTNSAKAELEYMIEEIVKSNEKKYVDFFNTAQPLSTRMHQIELLPGIGKKHMWQVIELRDEEPFKSFDDLKKRVKLMPDPKKAIIKRIISEIQGLEKHKIFVN